MYNTINEIVEAPIAGNASSDALLSYSIDVFIRNTNNHIKHRVLALQILGKVTGYEEHVTPKDVEQYIRDV